MQPRFERVALLGVGLIGGSLALAARAAGVFGFVIGAGRTLANLEEAKRRGIVDTYTQDLPAAVRGADLVVLAVPVRSMASVVAVCRDAFVPGAIVTDVGSVKRFVLDTVEPLLPPAVAFVGAHPIAGIEASGAAAATPDLFRGRRCVLTPGARSDSASLARIRKLWETVGMEVVETTPEEHDAALAWVSHLPHVLAFATARALEARCPTAAAYAGPSFASLTRVAASSAETWVDIFLSNRDALEGALDGFLSAVAEMRSLLDAGKAEELHAWLEACRQAHQRHIDAQGKNR